MASLFQNTLMPPDGEENKTEIPLWKSVLNTLSWTRSSWQLMSAFVLTLGLLGYFWWPLAADYLRQIPWDGEWWRYMDWLLLGDFLVMSLLIMARANLKTDVWIVFVGLCGGLVIESWGTQTNLWFYYTAERPPLWIIPAWPIASLSIDRLVKLMGIFFKEQRAVSSEQRIVREKRIESGEQRAESRGEGRGVGKAAAWVRRRAYQIVYWGVFIGFYAYMLYFVAPTFDKSFTWLALLLCALLIATPTDYRLMLLNFAAGSGLGYFLELWGTTRECWTYYTYQTPPFFAVLAHGMAAVAFWRALLVVKFVFERLWAALLRTVFQK
jgi:hypothetical protein